MSTEPDPAVHDPAYRAALLHAAMARRGLPTAPDTPAGPEILMTAAETGAFANRVIIGIARSQPHTLRYFAALLEAWSKVSDELAEVAEDTITDRLTGDLDGELGRLGDDTGT